MGGPVDVEVKTIPATGFIYQVDLVMTWTVPYSDMNIWPRLQRPVMK